MCDVAAFGPVRGIDDAVDERGPAGRQGFPQRCADLRRRRRLISLAAEGLYHVLVPGLQRGRRRVVGSGDVVAAVDTAVVEDHGDDWQVVAAHRLQLHATEPECAVALDRDDRVARLDGGGDRVAHTDTHHAPCPAVQPVPGYL